MRGDQANNLRVVGGGAETQYCLVAFSDFSQHARGGVKTPEIGSAFASEKLEDALAVRAPDGWLLAAGAGRRLVAEHALSDIVVKLCSEVPWLRVLRYVEHPQVRLGIGVYRLVLRSDKSELFAIWAKGEAIHTQINCR